MIRGKVANTIVTCGMRKTSGHDKTLLQKARLPPEAPDEQCSSHQNRIMVLTFSLGLVSGELPIAFRTVTGLGLRRVSEKAEQEIVARLKRSR